MRLARRDEGLIGWPTDLRTTSTLLLLPFLLLCIQGSHGQGGGNPPQVIDHKREHMFNIGQVLKLSCPVIGDETIMLYEWQKDGKDIRLSSERFKLFKRDRIMKSKKGVQLQDRGTYKCRGVNGFGRKEVTFIVHVIDPNAPIEESQCARNTKGQYLKGAPCFLDMAQMKPMRIVKEVGQEVSLACTARGKEPLRYDWFKDSSKANWITTAEGFRQSVLTIRKLQQTHTGRYSCLVHNKLGSLKYNYTLVVRPSPKSYPKILDSGRQNITVEYGETAQLMCRVKSMNKPYIRWMKQIDPRQKTSFKDLRQGQMDVADLKKHLYVVLKESAVSKDANDVYVSKMVIRKVTPPHIGKYLCVVFGHAKGNLIFQATFLRIRNYQSSGRPSDYDNNVKVTNPFHVIIYIAVPVCVLVVCIGVIIYCLVSRRRYWDSALHGSRPGGGPASGGGAGRGSGGGGGYVMKSSSGHGPPYNTQTKYPPHPVPQYEPYPLPNQQVSNPAPPACYPGYSSSSNGYSAGSGGVAVPGRAYNT